MNLTERIFSFVNTVYERESLLEFKEHFEKSGYGDLLTLPLLNGNGGETVDVGDIADLPLERVSFLRISNNEDRDLRVRCSIDIMGEVNTVEDLFDRFVRCCSHNNPLGDFRKYVDYYAAVYSGQRYFLNHGDGHCVALGLLFQAICREVLNEEITLYYCSSKKREIVHVYGRYSSSDSLDKYIDPDQKTLRVYADMEESLPHGYLLFMINRGGFKAYEDLISAGKEWLFPVMANESFSVSADAEMTICQNTPTIKSEIIHLEEARNKNSQIIDIKADDYEWKKLYRKAAVAAGGKSDNSTSYFLDNLQSPETFHIPSKGALEIGFGFRAYPSEIIDLFVIYYGRIPATIWFEVKKGKGVELVLPEFPWFLITKSSLARISLNGKKYSLISSDCGEYKILGMAGLEKALPVSSKEYAVTVEVEETCELGIGFPINAYAFNSGFASLEISKGAGTSSAIFN